MKVAADAEYKKRMEEAATLKRQRGPEDFGVQGQQQPSSFNQYGAAPDHEEAALKRRRLDDGSITSSFATPPPSTATNTNHGITRQHLMPLIQAFKNSAGASPLSAGIAEFDISTLPVNLVLELVVANLQVLSEDTLKNAVEKARQSLPPGSRIAYSEVLQANGTGAEEEDDEDVPDVKMEEEEVAAQDPLNLELDEDDLEGRALAAQALEKQTAADLAAAEAEAENALLASGTSAGRRRERSGTLDTSTTTSRQPSAEPSSSSAAAAASTSTSISTIPQALASSTSKSASNANKAKSKLLHSAIGRICSVGISSAANIQAGGGDKDLWIQLISRLVTRGLPDSNNAIANGDSAIVEEEDSEIVKKEKNSIRKQIFDFVTADLAGRMELARLWLNEEWYTEKKRGRRRDNEDAAAPAMDANGDVASGADEIVSLYCYPASHTERKTMLQNSTYAPRGTVGRCFRLLFEAMRACLDSVKRDS
jgi:symplekin